MWRMQNWRRSGLGQVLVDALAALCDEKTVVMLSNEDLWSYHDQLLLQASRAGFEVRTMAARAFCSYSYARVHIGQA
jgi:hypothetical protein